MKNLVKKQLKAFMKIFDSDVQKAFQRGSMFTKRFEDSSANVRSRFNAYCKAYEKQMKKISRSAAGISTTTADKDQNKLETELFLMEVAYVVFECEVRELQTCLSLQHELRSNTYARTQVQN